MPRPSGIWLLALLAAGPALAEPAPPAPVHVAAPAPTSATQESAALEEAKRHFTQGVALYNDGNFNAALAEFEAAYRSHPSPGVLYNIGLTQKALFRYDESIDTLSRYLVEAAQEKKLPAERKAEVDQLVNEMRALLADVALTVAPGGTQVVVDGRTVGAAPLKALRLAAGHHVLELSADGYKPVRREITLSAGIPLALTVALEAIPKTGRVRVTASQPGAIVRVDGQVEGAAPVEVELGAGGHALEVAADGFVTSKSELVVAAGQSRTVEVTLERPPRKPRFYEKWWFWTLGVAVAGGVAAGIAIPLAATTSSPYKGTLDPFVGSVK